MHDSQHVSRLLHPPTPGAYMTRRAKARPEIRARHTPGGRSGEGYGSATVRAEQAERLRHLGEDAPRLGAAVVSEQLCEASVEGGSLGGGSDRPADDRGPPRTLALREAGGIDAGEGERRGVGERFAEAPL